MKFAISATFTAEPLEQVIAFWGKKSGTPFHAVFAPYNQLSQTLLDPQSVFGRNMSQENQDGVNCLLLRADDLHSNDIEGHAEELIDQILATAGQRPVPLIVCICPSSPALAATSSRIVERFRQRLASTPSVFFLEPDAIQSLYPVSNCYSERGDRVARLPYSERYYAALGTSLVRKSLALSRAPYKVIVLDCDNTLWRGVCGEDGPGGVTLEPTRRAMHDFLKQQRAKGMLLAIASKNNPGDVAETFRQHPEFPLQPGDFAAQRINWNPKAENLRSLASELNLGLDSFLFIDDDPKECAEVQEFLPGVLTLPLPHDIDGVPLFLKHVWAFDQALSTEADRLRAASYESAREFAEELSAASSHEAFIANLNLKLAFFGLEQSRLARAAQMTQRTNQFNATTIRRNEAALLALINAGMECWTIDVSDRFGEYGQTGIVIFQKEPDELKIDTLALSCRVLGRGVEHRVLARLGAEATEQGSRYVTVPFQQTAKNRPVQTFLEQVAESCGVTPQENSSGPTLFRFPADKLISLLWRASPVAAASPSAESDTPRRQKIASFPYLQVASTLATADQILDAMRDVEFDHTSHDSMNAVERRLALIWSEILKIPSVALEDNFFDLGGHSLLVVLLQMRVHEEFDVELDVDEVYSGTLTLASLAAKIEMKQIGGLSPDEYRALVAEIESLPEDEVERLLASEGRAN